MFAEPVERALPELAVAVQPVGRCVERSPLQTRWPQLRFPASRDQAGMLEHLDVLGHRLKAQGEGLGEFVDRCLAVREPGEDRPSGRVGQRREGLAQFVDRHCIQLDGLSTIWWNIAAGQVGGGETMAEVEAGSIAA